MSVYNMEYKIILEAYDGPFDLLLSLIKKAEIDIYDIPIIEVTQQFLDYISEMEELNLEITSEFLLVAASLLEIKSKMLLPQEKIIEDGIEIEIDPRDDLVQRLIEYKLYKEAAERLKITEAIESKVYYKPQEDLSDFNNPEDFLGKIDLNLLVKALNNIMSRKGKLGSELHIGEIMREEYTLDLCIGEIKNYLKDKIEFKFTDLLVDYSRNEIIIYFLSILELIRLKTVYVRQDGVFSDLIITRRMDEITYGQ